MLEAASACGGSIGTLEQSRSVDPYPQASRWTRTSFLSSSSLFLSVDQLGKCPRQLRRPQQQSPCAVVSFYTLPSRHANVRRQSQRYPNHTTEPDIPRAEPSRPTPDAATTFRPSYVALTRCSSPSLRARRLLVSNMPAPRMHTRKPLRARDLLQHLSHILLVDHRGSDLVWCTIESIEDDCN